MTVDDLARATLAGYCLIFCGIVLWLGWRCPAGWRLWWLYVIASLYARLCFHWRANRRCPYLNDGPAIIIANHPTQYGFDDITLDPPVLTDTVTINYSADLRLVSDIVGAPVDELIALNPSLLRLVTPPDAEFDLHLPAGTASLFQEKIAAIPESKRNSWRYHKVTPDDTLASVAHTYRVSIGELAEVNQLRESSKLDGVDALVVPVAPSAAPSAHTVYYTTRRGDTLVSVADRFGVSLTQLRRWNKLPSSGIKIVAGRRLHVTEPTLARVSTHSRRAKGGGGHTREIASEASSAKEDPAPSHRSPAKTSSSHGSRKTHASTSPSSKRKHSAVSTKHAAHAKSSKPAQK